MKYKSGDSVLVRKDLKVGFEYNRVLVLERMRVAFGKKATIESTVTKGNGYGSHKIKLENGMIPDAYFDDSMFEEFPILEL